MNLTFASFAVLFTLLTADVKADLDFLVNTERAFARAAAERSVRSAFLEFIDDEGIIFRPTAG